MPISTTVKDGSGDRHWMIVNALGEQIIADSWIPELQADETADDSDKTFTVDADEYWRIQSIWVEYTSDGNAGNRELVLEIQDAAADVIARVKVGIVQAASLTRYYMLAPDVVELEAFRGTAAADYLSTIIPKFTLLSGWIVRIYDIAAVSAAGDDMVVQMIIEKKTIS